MTEPISDEELIAVANGKRGYGGRWIQDEMFAALLARLDAAERDLLIERTANRVTENHNHFDCAAEMAKLRIERDAALARAVPDGHTRIGGDVWRVTRGPHDDGTYRLVPADTERKPTS